MSLYSCLQHCAWIYFINYSKTWEYFYCNFLFLAIIIHFIASLRCKCSFHLFSQFVRIYVVIRAPSMFLLFFIDLFTEYFSIQVYVSMWRKNCSSHLIWHSFILTNYFKISLTSGISSYFFHILFDLFPSYFFYNKFSLISIEFGETFYLFSQITIIHFTSNTFKVCKGRFSLLYTNTVFFHYCPHTEKIRSVSLLMYSVYFNDKRPCIFILSFPKHLLFTPGFRCYH